MRTIAIVGTKGGTGKTTLLSCLAVALSDEGSVAVLDLDPQRSLTDWWDRRGQPDNPKLYSGIDSAADAADIIRADGKSDWLLIDTGPGLLRAIEPAVKAADVVLIPLKASALDLVALQPVLDIMHASGTPYLMVLNESVSTKMDTSAAELLRDSDHMVAKVPIRQRVAYRSAATTGKTGPEIDDKCEAELIALLDEVRGMIDLLDDIRGAKRRG